MITLVSSFDAPWTTQSLSYPLVLSAEGLKAALVLSSLAEQGLDVGPPIAAERLEECVNVLLSYQNPSGGWATYENQRSFGFLEASVFGMSGIVCSRWIDNPEAHTQQAQSLPPHHSLAPLPPFPPPSRSSTRRRRLATSSSTTTTSSARRPASRPCTPSRSATRIIEALRSSARCAGA